MDIMNLATKLLTQKLGDSGSANTDVVQSVLGNLLGGSGGHGIDLGAIVENLQQEGMGDIAKSWLGDGDNAQISQSQVESMLGSVNIQEAASKLGTDQNDLLAGLQKMLPQMVDKSSSGGSLLDSVGGLGGLAGLASKFLK